MLAACIAFAATATATAGAQRIVSLNLCADSLLLELVEPARIASLTFLSGDATLSPFAARVRRLAAGGLALNHGRVEEILPLGPDLVLVGSEAAGGATALLQKLGYPVLTVASVRRLADFRARFLHLAGVLGEAQRARALLARMDRRLAATVPARAPRPTALALGPNGYTLGADSLLDELLARAGFENLAPALGWRRSGFIDLETVVAAAPDLLVWIERAPAQPSLAHAWMRHPALSALARAGGGAAAERAVVVSQTLWLCGGTYAADAVEQLGAARAGLDR
ncbi:MAG: ABC transporter substrate-binding protein [Gammaproteobacteria bacterium]|nr:ABC transporter substrate-binding protein [Gammaproteobacteria bacterium]